MAYSLIFWTSTLMLQSVQVICLDTFEPIVARHCENSNICGEVLNYPHEYAEKIIENLNAQGHFWHSDSYTKTSSRVAMNPSNNYTNLCASNLIELIPLAARDADGEWRFVVNHLQRPMQVVHMEQCLHKDAPCGTGVPNLEMSIQMDYTSKCRQEHVIHQLTVLTKYGEVYQQEREYKSCCNCVLSQVLI